MPWWLAMRFLSLFGLLVFRGSFHLSHEKWSFPRGIGFSRPDGAKSESRAVQALFLSFETRGAARKYQPSRKLGMRFAWSRMAQGELLRSDVAGISHSVGSVPRLRSPPKYLYGHGSKFNH